MWGRHLASWRLLRDDRLYRFEAFLQFYTYSLPFETWSASCSKKASAMHSSVRVNGTGYVLVCWSAHSRVRKPSCAEVSVHKTFSR